MLEFFGIGYGIKKVIQPDPGLPFRVTRAFLHGRLDMDFFKTLIVDDSMAIRKILILILSIQFPAMIIGEAADGREALQKVEELQPNLIFMDIGLPDENGLYLTKRIKAKYPDTIIVIFSDSVSAACQETARGNDADYYMVKGKCSGSMILDLVELYLISRGYDRYGHKLNLARER